MSVFILAMYHITNIHNIHNMTDIINRREPIIIITPEQYERIRSTMSEPIRITHNLLTTMTGSKNFVSKLSQLRMMLNQTVFIIDIHEYNKLDTCIIKEFCGGDELFLNVYLDIPPKRRKLIVLASKDKLKNIDMNTMDAGMRHRIYVYT